ncbi:MAG: NAD-binding protein, partial [Planktomarina sp.]
NVLTRELGQNLLLIVALSMLITPLLFIAYDMLSKRMVHGGDAVAEDEIDEHTGIIIAGIGRFGQVVNRMVRMAGFQTTVLDNNLPTIELMRAFGFKGFYGDPTRPELLHAAGIEQAKVLVISLDDKAAAISLTKYARKVCPDLHIVARARDRVHVYELYKAGADDIVREMFDSSLRAGRYVLENMGLTEFDAAETEHRFFKSDRRAMLALADLWDPNIPILQNKAYVARAKQLDKELETDIVASGEGDAT